MLTIVLFLPLLCHSVADPNPFANEHEFDLFYGLPAEQYGYGSMGAKQSTLAAGNPYDPYPNNAVTVPTDVLGNVPTAASTSSDEAVTGFMNVAAASDSSFRSPQEFYCPQDNNAKFST